MKENNTTTITITEIEESDRDVSTNVLDKIHLSDGSHRSVWNGNASYNAYDVAKGRVEEGAELVSVEGAESHSGEPYEILVFA